MRLSVASPAPLPAPPAPLPAPSPQVRLWGCSRPASIARTLVVHVLTVAAHWTLLHLDKKELRALFSNKSALELLLRTVAPQVALLLFYGQVRAPPLPPRYPPPSLTPLPYPPPLLLYLTPRPYPTPLPHALTSLADSLTR